MLSFGLQFKTKVLGKVFNVKTVTYLNAQSILNDSTPYLGGTRTGAQIWLAFDKFINVVEGQGLWNADSAFHYTGWGDANRNKINVFTPSDTDSAHRLVFGGNVVHGLHEMYNNPTGRANPFITGTSLPDDFSMGVYSRTNVAQNTIDMGCTDVPSNNTNYLIPRYGANQIMVKAHNTSGLLTSTQTDSRRVQHAERQGSTLRYYNGTGLVTSQIVTLQAKATSEIWYMCRNVPASGPNGFDHSSRRYACMYILRNFATDAYRAAVNDLVIDMGASV